MARTVKAPEERRGELMGTALKLFLTGGYEGTSVEQITSEVGVAKGTFYHYFSTKQDLLEQMAEHYAQQLFEVTEQHMVTVGGTAPERMRELMRFSAEQKVGPFIEAMEIWRELYRDENVVLRYRLTEQWLERTRPLLAAIIEQGKAEGTFRIADADSTTDVVLSLWFDYGGRIGVRFFASENKHIQAALLRKAGHALEDALERVLGLHEGELDLQTEAYVPTLLGTEADT